MSSTEVRSALAETAILSDGAYTDILNCCETRDANYASLEGCQVGAAVPHELLINEKLSPAAEARRRHLDAELAWTAFTAVSRAYNERDEHGLAEVARQAERERVARLIVDGATEEEAALSRPDIVDEYLIRCAAGAHCLSGAAVRR